jgi:hypothetical protein
MRNISIFKERILSFLDYKGISKYECYQKTGISRSVLSQSNGMTEENLLKFLAYYREINCDWLIFGNEPMLRADNLEITEGDIGEEKHQIPAAPQQENVMISELLTRLENQAKEIGRLQCENEYLQQNRAESMQKEKNICSV